MPGRGTQARGRSGPSLRGKFIQYFDTKRNVWVTKRWPRGNGGNTPARLEAQKSFAAVVAMIKKNNGEQVAAAYDLARQKIYLPRDLMMAAAYGTIVEVIAKDGTVWKGVAVANQEIQALLQSITNGNAAMLVCDAGTWKGLAPGANNKVLTIDPATGLPDWLDAQGAAAGQAAQIFGCVEVQSPTALSANYVSAIPVVCPGTGYITRVGHALGTTSSTAKWAVGVYDSVGLEPKNLLAQSAEQTGFAIDTPAVADLTTPLAVAQYQQVWLAWWTDTAFTSQGGVYKNRVFTSWSSSTLPATLSTSGYTVYGISLFAQYTASAP